MKIERELREGKAKKNISEVTKIAKLLGGYVDKHLDMIKVPFDKKEWLKGIIFYKLWQENFFPSDGYITEKYMSRLGDKIEEICEDSHQETYENSHQDFISNCSNFFSCFIEYYLLLKKKKIRQLKNNNFDKIFTNIVLLEFLLLKFLNMTSASIIGAKEKSLIFLSHLGHHQLITKIIRNSRELLINQNKIYDELFFYLTSEGKQFKLTEISIKDFIQQLRDTNNHKTKTFFSVFEDYHSTNTSKKDKKDKFQACNCELIILKFLFKSPENNWKNSKYIISKYTIIRRQLCFYLNCFLKLDHKTIKKIIIYPKNSPADDIKEITKKIKIYVRKNGLDESKIKEYLLRKRKSNYEQL